VPGDGISLIDVILRGLRILCLRVVFHLCRRHF